MRVLVLCSKALWWHRRIACHEGPFVGESTTVAVSMSRTTSVSVDPGGSCCENRRPQIYTYEELLRTRRITPAALPCSAHRIPTGLRRCALGA